MELRAYWKIIWRRIWLVILIVGIVGLYVGYQYYHLRKTPGALTEYRSDIAIQIGLQASSNGLDPSYVDTLSVSESLADAFITGPFLTSNEFDTQVVNQIAADMSQIKQTYGPNVDLSNLQNSGAIGGALSASRAHNVVIISATWQNAAGAKIISTAVGEVTTANICSYVGYVVSKQASCTTTTNSTLPSVSAQVINSATDAAAVPGGSVNKVTYLFILLLVALLIALALIFLADYLDDRIYNKDDAANLLKLPIYGEVPRPPAVGRVQAKASSTK